MKLQFVARPYSNFVFETIEELLDGREVIDLFGNYCELAYSKHTSTTRTIELVLDVGDVISDKAIKLSPALHFLATDSGYSLSADNCNRKLYIYTDLKDLQRPFTNWGAMHITKEKGVEVVTEDGPGGLKLVKLMVNGSCSAKWRCFENELKSVQKRAERKAKEYDQ